MVTPNIPTQGRQPGTPNFGTIAAALRNQHKITYADLRRSRIGLFQDVGADHYVWMALPYWAPQGAGIDVGGYTVTEGENTFHRRLQMLPMEGLLQWIQPRIQSRLRTLSLAHDPEVEDEEELTANQIWTAAQIRQQVIIGSAGLRVAWHEDYAVHGGPFGLREAALNRDLALTFVEWQLQEPSLSFPINGRINLAFNACVSELTVTGDIDGFVGDAVLTPESLIYSPMSRTSTSPGSATTAGDIGLITNLARQAQRGSDFPAPLYGDE